MLGVLLQIFQVTKRRIYSMAIHAVQVYPLYAIVFPSLLPFLFWFSHLEKGEGPIVQK